MNVKKQIKGTKQLFKAFYDEYWREVIVFVIWGLCFLLVTLVG